jgi:DNA-binding NarL/FixJ family response regulator
MIHVIIVDDHTLFRVGMRSVLEGSGDDIQVVGEAKDGKTLFQLLETTSADCILLDIYLPDMSGVEIAQRLRGQYPEIKILIVSVENTIDNIQQLLKIGIDGFISKQMATEAELPKAIHSIMNGMEYFGKDIASIMYNIFILKNRGEKLGFTDREMEIIELCRKGFRSKEIANTLKISPRTVDAFKTKIFKRLGINSTFEMIQYAIKNGIVRTD